MSAPELDKLESRSYILFKIHLKKKKSPHTFHVTAFI